MIGMLSSSIVDISYFFIDRLKYFRSTVVHQERSVANLNLSSVAFRNSFRAFVKHRPQDILFQYSIQPSERVVWLCRMGVVNHLKELGSVSTIK
jgi:hypothetical protein